MKLFAKSVISLLLVVSQTVCAHEYKSTETEQEWENLLDLSSPILHAKYSKLTDFDLKVKIEARPVIDALLNVSKDAFWALDKYVEERIGASLHTDVLRVALAHRPDMGGLSTTSVAKPVTASSAAAQNDEQVIVLDYSSDGKDEEDRLSYYREDLALNLFHQFWHLNYPYGISIDRKGEVFGHLHRQITARYNFERFSNNLPRVVFLDDLRAPIKEGYTPKLFGLTDKVYPGRLPNAVLADVEWPKQNLSATLEETELWKKEILNAIEDGCVVKANGEKIILDEETGEGIIWNLMESNEMTVNLGLYGDYHNNLHILASRVHDPLNKKNQGKGAVGSLAMTVRDPLFFGIHGQVDAMADLFRKKLPPYKNEQLGFSGISVKSAEIISVSGKKNKLNTYLQQTDVLLLEGLDFDSPDKKATVRYTHVQHDPFVYKIQVENKGKQRGGTCRIFLAPKMNDSGLPFDFNDQRNFVIEMDKFYVSLKPGLNTIERKSVDSTVTIPPEDSFVDTTASENDPDVFVGCGYPHSLLVPRGNKAGMQAQLFVMITDYELDKVEGVDLGSVGNDNALSICGLKGSKYPDKRSMGYPFNRLARQGVTSLKDFLTSNMAVTDVIIKHDPSAPAPNVKTRY